MNAREHFAQRHRNRNYPLQSRALSCSTAHLGFSYATDTQDNLVRTRFVALQYVRAYKAGIIVVTATRGS
jgi:hypothetical protein